jgi:hypothetical protein
MKFAKIVFWAAGIWGVLVFAPLYFIFDLIGARIRRPSRIPASITASPARGWRGSLCSLSSRPIPSAFGR